MLKNICLFLFIVTAEFGWVQSSWVTLLALEWVDAICFLVSSVVQDWEKLCDFCSLHNGDGTLPLECQCLYTAYPYIANSTFFPLAYGVCFKSRDVVFLLIFFNFKSLLGLFLFLPPRLTRSELQCVSVSFVLSRLSSFISHCSFYFVLCDFFHWLGLCFQQYLPIFCHF